MYYEEEFKKYVFVHVGGGGVKSSRNMEKLGGGSNLRFIASKDSGKSIPCSYYLESC